MKEMAIKPHFALPHFTQAQMPQMPNGLKDLPYIGAVLEYMQSMYQERPKQMLSFLDLRVDLQKHAVTWKTRSLPRFTAIEFRLLSFLVENKGKVVTRENLITQVWGKEADWSTRTVDTHIKRLRKKLGPAAKYLQTIHCVGYVLDPH